MKKLGIFSVFCVASLILTSGFSAQPAQAQLILGDCNNDGGVSSADLNQVINYLSVGQLPPNPPGCDVDGTAGIHLSDCLQYIAHLYSPPFPDLIPYDGNGFSISDIEFTFPPIRPGGPEPFDVTLDLTDNPGPDLMGMIITFSYQHEAGHVGVSLDNVDFDGNIVPPEWETGYSTDPDNRKARIWLLALSPDDPPLAAGVEGLIATLTFTRTENIAGPTTFLGPAIFPPTQLPMVITSFYADDDTPPEERILIPRYVFVPPGDVTGDGVVNSADIIFLINFLFAGGPPPSGK